MHKFGGILFISMYFRVYHFDGDLSNFRNFPILCRLEITGELLSLEPQATISFRARMGAAGIGIVLSRLGRSDSLTTTWTPEW